MVNYVYCVASYKQCWPTFDGSLRRHRIWIQTVCRCVTLFKHNSVILNWSQLAHKYININIYAWWQHSNIWTWAYIYMVEENSIDPDKIFPQWTFYLGLNCLSYTCILHGGSYLQADIVTNGVNPDTVLPLATPIRVSTVCRNV